MATLAVAPLVHLSANDTRIFHALFDPEALPSSVARTQDASAIDPSLPPHPSISSSQLDTLETQQTELIRRINSTKCSSDREIVVGEVMRELDQVIERHLEYPSAYVNRAMVRRMKLEAMASSKVPSQSEKKLGIFSLGEKEAHLLFADLAQAISYSLPSASPASTYHARILRTAYSHRAYLYLKAAETVTEWNGKGKTELEELASQDFAQAAKYGDEKAREMSVRTNPYAKMCGAIVRNALSEERRQAGMEGL